MNPGKQTEEETLGKLPLEGLTYPCPRLSDFSLDDNLRPSGCSPGNVYIHKLPKVDLSTLGVIPLELLQGVLSQLDLCTLMGFRRVNRRAIEVVESIPQYKAITKYARNVLRGILSIQLGQWISCETVYEKLCTAECEECGDFGGYFYILTCKRVCFLCFSEEDKYLPLRHGHAIRKFGVNRSVLKTLPCMRSIPGTYSPNEKKSNERLTLVDSESVYRAGITIHGSISSMEQYVLDRSAQKLQDFDRRTSQAMAEGSGTITRRLRRPRTEDPFDSRSGNPMRFMAVVRMPWLNRESHKPEWGFHCIGCQKFHRSRPLHFRRKFTVASFGEHLRQCGNVRNGKHCRVDSEGQSEFRILVDRKFIKYLTIDPGLYDVSDMCFAPTLISMLPPLPPGDWNKGHISHDTSNVHPHFTRIAKLPLPAVTKVSHPLQIDYLELRMGQKLRSNWEIPRLDAETRVYQWIENIQIGPKFLGHLSERGRVIGFIIERINDCRHATPEDLSPCQQALSRLHELGIKHGDLNKHNFLIRNGKATLIDFENSTRCNDAKALEEESRTLQDELRDTTGRGGRTAESDAA
ncbi:hypothetical protein BDU57DRAFT_587687 [Ampelomyces quisqualis]|uniref:F-box domain-containing protein n=1 Tax=Ampelomyces quisqualis TaxID=50730 RepID=A0A6A5QQF6_AMPQU|nr:hypothetical protein BDU57DRAFT_587687 [Ampelomyces quisqualis]